MEKKAHKASLGVKSSNAPTAIATAIANSDVPLSGAPNTAHHNRHSHSHHTNSSSAKHRVSGGGTHHNNNNNNNSNAGAVVETVKSAAANTAGMEQQLTVANTKALSTKSKNEEAISDLRQRIPDIENIFDVHSRIGNGTFSTVLLGTLKKDRQLPENMRRKFAIKHHIPTSHPERIIKELKCMVEIGGSDNVVGINCTIRHNESVAFIMPYMPHDRFHDFFSKMDLTEVQCYMRNLLIALKRVHKFNVIHRDVKPSNFLYNRRKRQFLLVDFGLAQQVPTPVAQSDVGAIGAVTAANNAIEGKRSREQDDGSSINAADTVQGVVTAEISGTAKRPRCTGPQGDQSGDANASGGVANDVTNARGTNSCSIVGGGSTFKMPLKQLNEISAPTNKSGATTGANNTNSNGIYDAPLSRQVKSAILGATMTNRLQQKQRNQNTTNNSGGRSAANNSGAAAGGNTNTNNAVVSTNVLNNSSTTVTQSPVTAADSTTQSSKYNTNRNLSTSNAAKCCCYGNPQVCNICLIKKEIHASRAGTPGYRPPEVLLKYPDQTTAVDIWAAGVILLSILSSVYPFFKAPNDYVALAEMVTIFGDKTIRKTAFILDRLVTLSQKTKPLDLRKLCVRFRNRAKFSSPELLKKYQRADGTCEVCKNCDQFYFNCLCAETHYTTEPLGADDPFPASAYDLLYKLLEVNPHKRITAEEALKHPFFSEQLDGVLATHKKHNNNNND